MPDDTETHTHETGLIPALRWGAYLACSWTWCIGMLLPVLLLRDLGVWGWVVFAVPNVIGAAAFGFVLARPQASAQLQHEHRGACEWFTAVTVAFHVFFVAWFGDRLGSYWFGVIVLLVTAGLWTAMRWRTRSDSRLAIGVWLISAGAMVWFLLVKSPPPAPVEPSNPLSLPGLSAVCLFGFALCPYLDLTFHRARQRTETNTGKGAFALGFGVLFLVMIVFTFIYARWAAPLIDGQSSATIPITIRNLLVVHLALQASFTIAAHLNAMQGKQEILSRGPGLKLSICVMLAAIIGVYVQQPQRWFDLDAGEVVYRCFMGFYGLVFPAYVWLCVIPGKGIARGLTKGKLWLFAFVVGVTGPMLWMGFVEGYALFVMLAMTIVLLARFAVPRHRSQMLTE